MSMDGLARSLRVTQDEGELTGVQPGVDGNRDQAPMPTGKQSLYIGGTILHHQGNPVPGCQAVVTGETACDSGRSSGKCGVIGYRPRSRKQRCSLALFPPRPSQ